MSDVKKKDESSVQADNNSIAIGNISAGGDIGDVNVQTGYTSEQVAVLIAQIRSTFQAKPFDGRCPYKGLDVFEEEDAELFFGREKLVDDLVSRVKGSRTVFVTGPSGSGKSSLVRAGLIHALKQGAIKNSDRWLYATMTPGRDPLESLATAFSRLKSPELGNYFRQHVGQVKVLHECAESALTDNKSQRLVLFIDQFEEVFTQISKEDERIAFLNLLTHAATIENGRVIILFSMRSDFVSNCADYPKINALLNQQFVQIGTMQREELVSAIAQPAMRVGLRIDPDLIAQIINDMKGEPGALPLMQFALKDLFDVGHIKSDMIALTLEDYVQRGGIQKSLERHADAAFAKLSAHEQGLARSIFSKLIEIGPDTPDTRRTALFKELVPSGEKTEDVKSIVQKLADARLITTDKQAGQDTVTVSHEKLIDAWAWLRKLIDENRNTITWQNEIANDAREWEVNHRDESYLYRGSRLVAVKENVSDLVLNENAQAYLNECVDVEAREVVKLKRLKQGALALLVVLLSLGGIFGWAFLSKERAVPGQWVTIPAGSFEMGMNETEIEIADSLCQEGALDKTRCTTINDLPAESGRQINAELPEYSIMDNEVTNAQYQQCVDAGGCQAPKDWLYEKSNFNQPAANLNWFQSENYCKWLGGRLPTEGEWEKAARGPKNSYFPWGNDWDKTKSNLEHAGVKGVQSIVQYADSDISGYGVKNLAGNVNEWTTSEALPLVVDQTFSNDVFTRQDDGMDWAVIVRGGSWLLARSEGMAAKRGSDGILSTRPTLGFRCACPNGQTCRSPWDWKWIWFGKY